MVIDGKAVITGSFNFTVAAENRNAENVLIVHDDPALAKAYADNFWRRADDSHPPAANGD
jgi:phosphatidylserine/phosphatidylglycerophosphate/cardiolipin synthase-like enzyme